MNNSTIPSGVTPFVVEIIGERYTNDGKHFGITLGKGSDGEVLPPNENDNPRNLHSGGQDWYGVQITLYLNSLKPLSTAKKRSIILHELGHALKLAHTTENSATLEVVNDPRGGYSDFNRVCSIMNYEEDDGNDLYCYSPTWHDMINLRNKWG
ncbi:MAG: hypothetical protein IKS90_04285 [Clostridia bacterium]|nr:hypothetical protein [Clostridia bacterium]